ncbi:MAG: N-6 DNA methylase [Dehalococcoidia bacterium]|nr:N-6 DNA methylase [Dehalococcoidia bacterium]
MGALLPSDVLAKAAAGEGLEGLADEDFGIDAPERLRDVIHAAWSDAQRLWWSFRSELRLGDETADPTATTPTRERWLLPFLEILGFEGIEVEGRAITVGDVGYPISHMWKATPMHLMGARVELDAKVAGVRGAASMSPHSLMQQMLNRSDKHLWGLVSNGRSLRLLRDSVSLTRQAFVEFDLESMFGGEVFADFVVLYRVLHATRFAGGKPEDCLLERWITAARDEGIRAQEQLRGGVQDAITALGSGFLSHPENTALREAIERDEETARDLYRHLLRLVYRMLFLFVVEDREMFHPPDTPPEARDRYRRYYSTTRLRELAETPAVPGHVDLWEGLGALMKTLGDRGEPLIGAPALGSFLWADDAIGPLRESNLDNRDLLFAVQRLAYVEEDGRPRRVDFAALGAEELGSVYEALLELHPRLWTEEGPFSLGGGAGSERRETGSYYTPTVLVRELLDSALDPVLERAASSSDPEDAILALNIVDPAAGSGHFLVAAAHRLARRLAQVRTGEPEPPEVHYRTALREVISRCLYGVDVNELAVELCKVGLWLEAVEPGRPLSFLDHHIVVGNSLIGAFPRGLVQGIPEGAFTATSTDDRKVAAELKKRNRTEHKARSGAMQLRLVPETAAGEMSALDGYDDTDLDSVHVKEELLDEWKKSEAYARSKLVADAWCAAFMLPKRAGTPAFTEADFRNLRDRGVIATGLRDAIQLQAEQHSFHHWHLAFPQVFRVPEPGEEADNGDMGWSGGFDVVLGNPPWEKVKLNDKEFFASRAPEVAAAPTAAARKRMIDELDEGSPTLHAEYLRARSGAERGSQFLRTGGRFPRGGAGDVNLYAVFSELFGDILDVKGRAGLLCPTGIATDDTTKNLFAHYADGRIESLYDFENRDKLFDGIDSRMKFCLLTLRGAPEGDRPADFAFFCTSVHHLREADRHFTLSTEDFELFNPNTRTCPVFRSKRDAEIARKMYQRAGVLWKDERDGQPEENPWGVKFSAMFHMSNDSGLFRTREELEGQGYVLEGNVFVHADGRRYLPLYEAKLFHQYDHRFATFKGVEAQEVMKGNARELPGTEKVRDGVVAIPRYWVPSHEVTERIAAEHERMYGSEGSSHFRGWHLSFRDITNATNERTALMAVLPEAGIGNTAAVLDVSEQTAAFSSRASAASALLANFDSMVLDWAARFSVGGTHMNFFIVKQLPILGPEVFVEHTPGSAPWLELITPRVLELTYSASDLTPFARSVGYEGPPFGWNDDHRHRIKSELDAVFAHMYGLDREDLEWILDAPYPSASFPGLKHNEEREYGEYRTQRYVLKAYDQLARGASPDLG